MKKLFYTYLSLLLFASTYAQNGKISGRITDGITNESLPYVSISIQGSDKVTQSDSSGVYRFEKLVPGLYNLKFNFIGYQSREVFEVEVTNNKAAIIDVNLEQEVKEIKEVEVRASSFKKTQESPVSLRTIGLNEIQRYPGGNRDISKVIQSLPGVATVVSFRNDIIIRGGSPSENKFYLDGIEVPTINHFSTQGASGGPVGLLNVDLIKEVDFYSSAFPANLNTGLSSAMQIKLKDGRSDRVGFNFAIGASEAALSLEGPMNKKKTATFFVSARQSYLQLLFKLFQLPFLPTYNDFQIKQKTRFNDKHELEFLAVGTYDRFKLNLDANETEDQRYLLNVLPVNTQWFYAVGGRYRLFTENGGWTFIVSRNMLSNKATKYLNNDDSSPANLVLSYKSEEIENKLRIENTTRVKGFKVTGGLSYEFDKYTNNSFTKINTPFGIDTVQYNSLLTLHRYGIFAQISRAFIREKFNVSIGLRADGNTYNVKMAQLYRQISPRLSLSYQINKKWAVNFNTGLYYQTPAYTTLGFRENDGTLSNKDRLDYISCTHVVGGVEYNTDFNARFTVEGFFKYYDRYPFLLRDSIPLANQGGGFGVIGNEPASSVTKGRSYGFEFLYQQRLFKGFFGSVSYTFFFSEFEDKNQNYVPSSWDTRHIISLTFGKKFKRNFEAGLVFKASGGAPFTPIDSATSSIRPVWDIYQSGLLDYDQLNTGRLNWFTNLDIRVSKKWYVKKFSLELYLDIQNVYNFKADQPRNLTVERDSEGRPIVNPDNPAFYKTKFIPNPTGQILPSIGVVFGL